MPCSKKPVAARRRRKRPRQRRRWRRRAWFKRPPPQPRSPRRRGKTLQLRREIPTSLPLKKVNPGKVRRVAELLGLDGEDEEDILVRLIDEFLALKDA